MIKKKKKKRRDKTRFGELCIDDVTRMVYKKGGVKKKTWSNTHRYTQQERVDGMKKRKREREKKGIF